MPDTFYDEQSSTYRVQQTMPATGFDHLCSYVSNAYAERDPKAKGGVTRCACGWVASSDDHRAAYREWTEHRGEAIRQEDAAAQSGYIPESWRRT